jgi:hypothetical protein
MAGEHWLRLCALLWKETVKWPIAQRSALVSTAMWQTSIPR